VSYSAYSIKLQELALLSFTLTKYLLLAMMELKQKGQLDGVLSWLEYLVLSALSLASYLQVILEEEMFHSLDYEL